MLTEPYETLAFGEKPFKAARGLGAALALLALLAACTPGPSLVSPNPLGGIELRWEAGQGSIEQAKADAAERCTGRGQDAVLVEEFTDGDETVARFTCQ